MCFPWWNCSVSFSSRAAHLLWMIAAHSEEVFYTRQDNQGLCSALSHFPQDMLQLYRLCLQSLHTVPVAVVVNSFGVGLLSIQEPALSPDASSSIKHQSNHAWKNCSVPPPPFPPLYYSPRLTPVSTQVHVIEKEGQNIFYPPTT